jgi:hypothetical protein
MDNDATRNGSTFGALFGRLSAAIGRWRCSQRAALMAADTYEATRSTGASHDVAANAAFEALTGNERPVLPDGVDTAQSLQAAPLHRPESEGRPAGWAAPEGTY